MYIVYSIHTHIHVYIYIYTYVCVKLEFLVEFSQVSVLGNSLRLRGVLRCRQRESVPWTTSAERCFLLY